MRITMPASWFVVGLSIVVTTTAIAGYKYKEASMLEANNRKLKELLNYERSSSKDL